MTVAVYSSTDSPPNIRRPEPHQELIECSRKKHFDVITIFFKLLGKKYSTDICTCHASSQKLGNQCIKIDGLPRLNLVKVAINDR
ncbi:hypothetical protein D3C77_312140 [compost metagenome]